METVNKRTIIIDLKQNTIIPLPQFIQNDTNVLEMIVKDNGVDADLSDIGRIVVNYRRPDKKKISRLLTAAGNTVSYKIGLDEMELPGQSEVEVQFFNTDNTQRISTKRFKIMILESIGTDEIYENDGDLTLLQELFIEVRTVNDELNAAEAIRVSNENKRIDAENIRTSNENTRKSNEDTRVANENARKNNESTRQTNETARQTNTAKAIKDAEKATSDANNAATFANEQGNYAKQEADRLVNVDMNQHLLDPLPHQFKDDDTSKTYRYGLKQQGGHMVFVCEEVI